VAVVSSVEPQVQERPAPGAALARFVQGVVAASAVASITLALAFFLGSILITCTSTDPFSVIGKYGLSLGMVGHLLHYPYTAFDSLFTGAFGGPDLGTTSVTLSQALPLVFTGLAVAFAFRGGLFNIGAEGQLVAGALLASVVGVSWSGLPGILLAPAVLVASVLSGLAMGAIAGVLKAYRGAHEVITTIMLNYIAIYGATALVESSGPLNAPNSNGQAVTAHAGAGALLPFVSWLGKGTTLDAGAYLVIVCLVVYWFVFNRTSLGYEITAIGLNPGAAAYGGIPVKQRIVLTMAIAGGLGGLAGGLYIADPTGTGAFEAPFDPGWGFDGISIALLGKGNPVGMLLSALLFGALRTGSQSMQLVGVSPHMTEVLQGIIVLFIALDVVVGKLLNRRRGASGGTASGTFMQEWRGLLVLAAISATIAVLFSHLFFGILAFGLAGLYVLARRQATRGVLVVVVYSAICLALGLLINQYL
jgi:simple sugar transport system permease protein